MPEAVKTFVEENDWNAIPNLEFKGAITEQYVLQELQAKSLKSFHQKFQNEVSVRTSLSDYIPLYEIGWCLKTIR